MKTEKVHATNSDKNENVAIYGVSIRLCFLNDFRIHRCSRLCPLGVTSFGRIIKNVLETGIHVWA